MTQFSEQVYQKLDDAAKAIGVSASKFQESNHLNELVFDWFKIIWHVSKTTTTLMNFAVEEVKKLPSNKFLKALESHFIRHGKEEEFHGDWLLEDIHSCGYDIKLIIHSLPPLEVTSLVGSQYYLIKHYHPVLVLGYSALLEGYPASSAKLKSLKSKVDQPDRFWRTYELHTVVDHAHKEGIVNILNQVPDIPFLRKSIVLNGLRSAKLITEAFENNINSKIAAPN